MSRTPLAIASADVRSRPSAARWVLGVIGMLCATGMVSGSFAQEPQVQGQGQGREDSVDAPVIRGITIDGKLDDWPAAMPRHAIDRLLGEDPVDRLGYGGLEDANLSTSPDLSAAFSVGYDPREQLLYLAVIVRDDKLVIGHTSHLDTDAIEVFIDGLHSTRMIPFPGEGGYDKLKLEDVPVQQYIGIPGAGKIYGKPDDTNPIVMFGDVKKTKTRMAYHRKGDVTTYEWAIQVFDRYPDRPTRLELGKRIGFDIAVVDKDTAATTPQGINDPKENQSVWIYWGPRWNGIKTLNGGSLGEIFLVN